MRPKKKDSAMSPKKKDSAMSPKKKDSAEDLKIEDELQELYEQIRRLRDTCDTLENENESLRNENGKLQTSLDDLDATVAQYEQYEQRLLEAADILADLGLLTATPFAKQRWIEQGLGLGLDRKQGA